MFKRWKKFQVTTAQVDFHKIGLGNVVLRNIFETSTARVNKFQSFINHDLREAEQKAIK